MHLLSGSSNLRMDNAATGYCKKVYLFNDFFNLRVGDAATGYCKKMHLCNDSSNLRVSDAITGEEKHRTITFIQLSSIIIKIYNF